MKSIEEQNKSFVEECDELKSKFDSLESIEKRLKELLLRNEELIAISKEHCAIIKNLKDKDKDLMLWTYEDLCAYQISYTKLEHAKAERSKNLDEHVRLFVCKKRNF